jgi:pilus assembly protein Flp/PilA
MRAIFIRFLRDRRGATAIEYAMIVTVLSLAIVSSINMTHNELSNMFVRVANRFATGVGN